MYQNRESEVNGSARKLIRTRGKNMLLGRADFRRAYTAGAISQLGDSFQFVAVLWLAVVTGGPFGVIAVRLADGLPALLLALHGGASADRRDRKRTMIAADLARGGVLSPVAVAGLTGHLSIWAVAPAGLVVATCSSYFVPAFGASVPALVGRENAQRANALMASTNSTVMVGGRALAAALLAGISIGSFFAVNAVSFFVSAALLARTRLPRPAPVPEQQISVREGFAALRPRPGLLLAIAMLGLGTAVMTGVWTVGVAQLAHDRFHGASALALLLTLTALGTILGNAVLVRWPVRWKVRRSCAAWALMLPGFALLAAAPSLPLALAGTFVVGIAAGATLVLVITATQESVPDAVLGRAMGIVTLATYGAKPLGLLLVAPLYAVVGARTMFVAGGVVVAVAGLGCSLAVASATRALQLAHARSGAP
jgi:predicted MFS family arabinose efflux permease